MHTKNLLPTLLFLVACQTQPEAPNTTTETITTPLVPAISGHSTPFLGVWVQEDLLQKLILEEKGLCYLEEFIPEKEGHIEDDPYRRCYGVWRQLENQIELAVYCTPESNDGQISTRFTYHAQKDELLNPDGDAFSRLTGIDEKIDLPPPQDIIDYFIRLPAEYLTFSSSREDYYFTGNKNFLTVIDRRNGYLAGEQGRFEAALFRRPDRRCLLVVSNRRDGINTTEYDAYFLIYDANTNTWKDVRQEVLPPLPPSLFFRDPDTPEQSPAGDLHYRFDLSRRCAELLVRLQIRRENSGLSAAELHPVVLRWDRVAGRFGLE